MVQFTLPKNNPKITAGKTGGNQCPNDLNRHDMIPTGYLTRNLR